MTVTLSRAALTDLLEGMQVFDSRGSLIGIVEEALAPDKVLDCLIVRNLEDNFVYVTPEDIKSIGHDVLRHRIIPSFEAEAENKTADQLLSQVFDSVPVP